MSAEAICDTLAWVYFIGMIACLIRAIDAAQTQQTPHGHAVILPPGFALALVWPLAVLWWMVGGLRRG